MPKGHYAHQPRGSKREEILDAATRVYAHYGFEGATLQRMAEEAGVTRPLIAKYFGSKQGLVRAIADRAVSKSLTRLREIDETPGLTLRGRAEKQLAHLMPIREEWCLILGTLLVPSFQFTMRGEVEEYLTAEYEANLRHSAEFRNPSPEAIYAYTYADVSMRIGYIVGGRADALRAAQKAQQDLYLLPEAQLRAAKKQF